MSANLNTLSSWVLGENLIHAATNGDLQSVNEILALRPALVNVKDNMGYSALAWATAREHTEIIERLIAVHTAVDAGNNHDWNTLRWAVLGNEFIEAVKRGNLSRTEEIIAHYSVLINFQNSEGHTALMMAASWGHTEIVQRLIAQHADIDIASASGWTALMEAARWGHTDIVKKLIAENAAINATNTDHWTALMLAVFVGSTESVQALLDARADITIHDSSGKNALRIAHNTGHTAIVELLENHVAIEPEEETVMVKPAH